MRYRNVLKVSASFPFVGEIIHQREIFFLKSRLKRPCYPDGKMVGLFFWRLQTTTEAASLLTHYMQIGLFNTFFRCRQKKSIIFQDIPVAICQKFTRYFYPYRISSKSENIWNTKEAISGKRQHDSELFFFLAKWQKKILTFPSNVNTGHLGSICVIFSLCVHIMQPFCQFLRWCKSFFFLHLPCQMVGLLEKKIFSFFVCVQLPHDMWTMEICSC